MSTHTLESVEPYLMALYKGGRSTTELGKMFGFSSEGIRKRLKRAGIRMRTTSEAARKHILNHHYFDRINTHNKAFWLGFLLARGNVQMRGADNYVISCIVPVNKSEYLRKLSMAVGSSKSLFYYKKSGRVRFSISSTSWAESLQHFGWSDFKNGNVSPLFSMLDDTKLIKAIMSGHKAATE